MTDHLQRASPRRSWEDLAAITLVVGISSITMGLTTMKTALVSSHQAGLLAPDQTKESAE